MSHQYNFLELLVFHALKLSVNFSESQLIAEMNHEQPKIENQEIESFKIPGNSRCLKISLLPIFQHCRLQTLSSKLNKICSIRVDGTSFEVMRKVVMDAQRNLVDMCKKLLKLVITFFKGNIFQCSLQHCSEQQNRHGRRKKP